MSIGRRSRCEEGQRSGNPQGGFAGHHSGERTAITDLAIPGTSQAGYLYNRQFQAGRLF
jgi:hypothetical protein